MAKSVLDIVISTVKKGGADKETVKGLTNIKKAIADVTFIGGGLIAVGYAMKKAYDFGKEGAMLELTRGKFDRLAESIGTTSDALLGDLKTATGGINSDMELIASTTDMVALGLANTHDEAVRLAAVSGGLNMDMNQLVLTLTNMTTMRFDALGVRVDGFKDKVKKLEEAGYSADAAFKEAFLQQAEAQLLLVGNAADTAAGSYMRLEASLKNIADAAKMEWAQGLLPVINMLNNYIERNGTEVEKTQDKWATWAGVIFPAVRAFETLGDVIAGFTDQMDISSTHIGGRHKAVLNDYTDQVDNATSSVDSATTAVDSSTLSYMAQAEAMMRVSETSEILAVDYEKLIPSIQNAQSEMDRYKETQNEINAANAQANADFESGNISLDERNAILADNQVKLAENAAAHNEWAAQTVYSFAMARAAADGIDEAEGEMLIGIGEQLGLFDAKTAQAMQAVNSSFASLDTSDAEATVAALQDSLEALTGHAWVINIKTQTTGTIPSGTGDYRGYATGGAFDAGQPMQVHRDEIMVPDYGGVVLTRTDAMRLLSGQGGNTDNSRSVVIHIGTIVAKGSIMDVLEELT